MILLDVFNHHPSDFFTIVIKSKLLGKKKDPFTIVNGSSRKAATYSPTGWQYHLR